jgi:poly(A) polymerase
VSDGTSEPRILSRPEHPVSRKDISPNTLKVLYRLRQRGHKAYMVGGSGRDLMLGRQPKDFDVATDASPQEVPRLFRNSRIIGRRFRLVHVVFESEVVEVSTFRGSPKRAAATTTSSSPATTPSAPRARTPSAATSRSTPCSTTSRTFSVIDYVGGIEDLKRRVVRVIGDPDVRLQEDPVRMMRACEYAGRLGFGIETATQESSRRQRQKLDLASPVRITEEILQLMRCGSAGGTMQWMLDLGLLEVLLPEAYAMLGVSASGVGDFGRLLPTVDRLVGSGRPFGDAPLLAVLLLPKVLRRRDDVEAIDQRPMTRAALRQLTDETVGPFAARLALSRARSMQVTQARVAFHRLCEPGWTPRGRLQFAHRPYCDDALALFELMVEATGDGREALAAWQAAGARSREALAEESPEAPLAAGARRSRRRRRGRRRESGGTASGAPPAG